MIVQDSNFAVLEHILGSISRPRPGDSKEPTQWPSEGTAVVVLDDGQEQVQGQCRRQAFFRLTKENYKYDPAAHEQAKDLVDHLKAIEIPVGNYMRFIWAQGELYEQYVVDQCKNSGIFVHTQVPVYIKSHNISGKIDIIVIDPETSLLSITEVKSVYSYGADAVIGTDAERRRGLLGTPRDKNLIQTALYHWWVASEDEAYGPSRLIYGDRGTGKYGEYLVRTETADDGIISIWYRGITPNKTKWTRSPITITSILEQYALIARYVREHKIPPRDFKLQYSWEDFNSPAILESLNKTDRTQIEKIAERKIENVERLSRDEKPKVDLKLPDKGDHSCRFCPWQLACYDKETGQPTGL